MKVKVNFYSPDTGKYYGGEIVAIDIDDAIYKAKKVIIKKFKCKRLINTDYSVVSR